MSTTVRLTATNALHVWAVYTYNTYGLKEISEGHDHHGPVRAISVFNTQRSAQEYAHELALKLRGGYKIVKKSDDEYHVHQRDSYELLTSFHVVNAEQLQVNKPTGKSLDI
jgi:hypothetical protein